MSWTTCTTTLPLTKSDRCCLITTRNRKDNPLRFLFFGHVKPACFGWLRKNCQLFNFFQVPCSFSQVLPARALRRLPDALGLQKKLRSSPAFAASPLRSNAKIIYFFPNSKSSDFALTFRGIVCAGMASCYVERIYSFPFPSYNFPFPSTPALGVVAYPRG